MLIQLDMCQFRSDDQRPPEWNRNRVVIQCEQRVIKSTRFEESFKIVIERSEKSDSLVIKWDARSGWAKRKTIVIQAHYASRCSHLKRKSTSKQISSITPHSLQCFSHPVRGCLYAPVAFESELHQLSGMQKADQSFILISDLSDKDSFIIVVEDFPVAPYSSALVSKDLSICNLTKSGTRRADRVFRCHVDGLDPRLELNWRSRGCPRNQERPETEGRSSAKLCI